MKLAEFVVSVRLKLGLKQIELAKKLKITQGTVSHIETGRRLLSAKLFEKLIWFCKENNIKIERNITERSK
jgi:transcriptional regulator with XRE-family HTH domain